MKSIHLLLSNLIGQNLRAMVQVVARVNTSASCFFVTRGRGLKSDVYPLFQYGGELAATF